MSDAKRQGSPAHTRPHVHASAHGPRAHATHHTFVRSRCAGVALSIGIGLIAVIICVVAAVAVASSSLPVAAAVHLRCRAVHARGCVCTLVWDPGRDSQRRLFRTHGYSVVGGCCSCPWGAMGPPRCASTRIWIRLRHVCTVRSPVLCRGQGRVKPVPCARVGSNCAFFCIISLIGIIDGPQMLVFSKIGDDGLPRHLKPPDPTHRVRLGLAFDRARTQRHSR